MPNFETAILRFRLNTLNLLLLRERRNQEKSDSIGALYRTTSEIERLKLEKESLEKKLGRRPS